MRRSNVVVLFTVALCSAFVPRLGHAEAKPNPKAAGGGVEQQLDGLTDRMVQAQLHGDPAAYERYYAEDAIIIHAPGTLFTKAEEIANLKSGEIKYDGYDVRDKKIHVHGDTAVVEILASVKGSFKGKPFDSEFRVTRVWARSKGDWKVVVFQTTRITPPSP